MAGVLGRRVVHVEETVSTNDDLRDLALRGEPEGLVVRADRQVGGRGRAGRAWASPAGGLWFSVLLRPGAPPARWGLLPLAVGAGVAAAARARGAEAQVKWPNDVLVAGRKVAGVLCESRLPPDGFVVAGVGVNADVRPEALPPELRGVAGSLGERDLDALLADALREIEARYRAVESGALAGLLAEQRAWSATLGRRVAVGGHAGVAVDLREDGSLVVEAADGARRVLVAGDVELLG